MEPFGRIVGVPAGAASLYGELNVPEGRGSTVILIARALGLKEPLEAENELARALAEEGHATLIVDLVEAAERERIAEVREDPGLLANRLIAVSWWLIRDQTLYEPMLGMIGMPTAAEAALEAASIISDVVRGLVIVDGQPRVNRELLEKVGAPTLLIVGAQDSTGVEAHREVLAALDVEKRLHQLPGSGEEFTEPIEWSQVTEQARSWLSRYVTPLTRGEPASTVGSQAEP